MIRFKNSLISISCLFLATFFACTNSQKDEVEAGNVFFDCRVPVPDGIKKEYQKAKWEFYMLQGIYKGRNIEDGRRVQNISKCDVCPDSIVFSSDTLLFFLSFRCDTVGDPYVAVTHYETSTYQGIALTPHYPYPFYISGRSNRILFPKMDNGKSVKFEGELAYLMDSPWLYPLLEREVDSIYVNQNKHLLHPWTIWKGTKEGIFSIRP